MEGRATLGEMYEAQRAPYTKSRKTLLEWILDLANTIRGNNGGPGNTQVVGKGQ